VIDTRVWRKNVRGGARYRLRDDTRKSVFEPFDWDQNGRIVSGPEGPKRRFR
jgi:hypothetical protein